MSFASRRGIQTAVKVLYYSKYSDEGPSSRYRVFQFLDSFRAAGVDLHIQSLFDHNYFNILQMKPGINRDLAKVKYVAGRFRGRMSSNTNDADLVVVEGQLFPYLPFQLEKRYLPPKYLLEFDDALYLTHPSKLPKVIGSARAIIAGNRTLGAFAERYNKDVHLVPTVVNTERFSPQPKSASDKLRIGWTGLEYNYKYLRTLTPVFWKLTQKYPVEIVLLSASSPQNFRFPFRFVKWESGSESKQINDFDIGIMPLEMDEWCKGKCGFKLLQYMSLGIPAVATPVGVNAEILRPGENGFAAIGLNEWEEALTRLISDAKLREEVGRAARQTVVERYSADVWFPRILELYSQYSQ
jgi:glycosyltransferase involved in cell wall biosynthesis